MVTEPDSLPIPTLSKEPLTVSVNWNAHAKKCSFVKLQFEGKQLIVPKASFLRAAFYVANAEEQDKLIPTRTIKVKQFKKLYTITLKKDFSQGEQISVPITIDVPVPDGYDELPIIIR